MSIVISEVFYFGCIGESGHHLWRKQGGPPRHEHNMVTPWGDHLDGGILRDLKVADNPAAGVLAFARKDGWFAVSFWDRSVDKRGNCNSSFLVKSDSIPDDDLLRLAAIQWPEIFSRPGFPIKAPLPVPKLPIQDTRSPIKARGWAPGSYLCTCGLCQKEFLGAKRASTCSDCAYDESRWWDESPPEKSRQARAQSIMQDILINHLPRVKEGLEKGYVDENQILVMYDHAVRARILTEHPELDERAAE